MTEVAETSIDTPETTAAPKTFGSLLFSVCTCRGAKTGGACAARMAPQAHAWVVQWAAALG